MKIGTIKQILKDDLKGSGDLPGWLDSFLTTLNQFITQVATALKGRLTFADNFSCKPITLTFIHGVALEINPLVAGLTGFKVLGLLPIQCPAQGYDASTLYLLESFGYAILQNGNISTTLRFAKTDGTAPAAGTALTCSLIILLG